MYATVVRLAVVTVTLVATLAAPLARAADIDLKRPLWGTNGNYKALYALPDADLAAYKDYVVAAINKDAPEYAWNQFLALRADVATRRIELSGPSVNACVRSLLSADALPPGLIGQMKQLVVASAIRYAKQTLAAAGKSFVTTNKGANPMEPLLRPVVTALDAPGFEGLRAALTAIGWTVNVSDLTPLPVGPARDAVIAQLQSRMVDADTPTPGDQGLLLKLLGTAAYNDFVAQFNGTPTPAKK